MSRAGHRLIAFDAFGTLFRPRAPVAEQYALVTKNYLSNLYPDEFPRHHLDRVEALKTESIAASFKRGMIFHTMKYCSHP
jgi:FMN phosphatase YigB (HAD superfamily)